MKIKLLIASFIIVMSFVSCENDAQRIERLFDRSTLLEGISEDIQYFLDSPRFRIGINGPQSRDEMRRMPAFWIEAESEDLVVTFWPLQREEHEPALYRLQVVDVKRETDNYFLGRFIGMTPEQIFRRYPRPPGFQDRPFGENHIFFQNADQSQFIRLWMLDNVVIRAAFAYSLGNDGDSPQTGCLFGPAPPPLVD